MDYLLHPELIRGVPFVGKHLTRKLNERAAAAAADDPALDPPISVVIRALNEAPKLELLLQDIAKQNTGHKIEVIIVDNESTDNTRLVAQKYGAKVVTLPRNKFTYPRSMNLGVEAASHDAVFLTVAHARLATTQTLHAAARHFRPGTQVAGVFGSRVPLPSDSASRTEKLACSIDAYYTFRPAQSLTKATMGVMGAVNAMFSKAAWEKLGRFDERYETGGEDTVLAQRMLAAGYKIIRDPAVMVHHAHGLGPVATYREVAHFGKVLRNPQNWEGDIKARRQARFES